MYKFIIACVLSLTTLSFPTHASETVQGIIPFAPGGGNDIVFRHFGKWVLENKKIDIKINYKPGANGQVGVKALSLQPNDGTWIGLMSIAAVGTTLVNHPEVQVEYVTAIRKPTELLVASKKSNIKDFESFKSKLTSNHNSLKIAYGGPTQKSQLQQLLNILTPEKNVIMVGYKGGGPLMNDLLGGHVDIASLPYHQIKSHLESGDLILLASNQKFPGLSKTLILEEAYSNYIGFGGSCIVFPKGTPEKVLVLWRTIVVDYLNDPETKEALKADFSLAHSQGGENLEKLIGAFKSFKMKNPD